MCRNACAQFSEEILKVAEGQAVWGTRWAMLHVSAGNGDVQGQAEMCVTDSCPCTDAFCSQAPSH